MSRAREEIEAAGTRVVLVGQATPKHAAHYRRRYAKDLEVLADEERGTYKTIGATRGGASELFNPNVVLKGIARSVKEQQVQGRVIGDARQLGATLLVMPDGSIPWSHMSTDAADNATVEEILEALEQHT